MPTDFTSLEARNLIDQEMPFSERGTAQTIFERLTRTKDAFGARSAFSFQITSGPKDKAETLTWHQVHSKTAQAANMFRSLGVTQNDVVAYILPNCNETAITLLGGMVAGIVNPINPLLEPEQIASILRETNAKVVVTLRPFPKSDVSQKVAEAVKHAPNVTSILEVDLLHYLSPPKSWIVPFIRPKKAAIDHHANVLNFQTELDKQPTSLTFEDTPEDRVAAYFHTGGTTGMPKVAQHQVSGMMYNGWLGSRLLFTEQDNIMCPLPMFHVFACHVIIMAMISSGAQGVFPTPQGYRGEGVFDNFWKLLERWEISFVITVPTALAALMQRPIDADISCVKTAFSGSSPLPVELYKRFEKATDIEVIEGYGLTEATCLVAVNPIRGGVKKIGSVGLPLPHTDVKILAQTADGPTQCPTDEVGEICISSPGVYAGSTYTETDKNHDLFHEDVYLRTGDLGRIDEDGYLWITGRAKDLIIRGGHNIDPAEIEEALAGHADVAFVGAIGQPDKYSGELPCAYVELVDGATASSDELMQYARTHIKERAAHPKHLEIIDALPKTAVGKVFKPDLRKMAIARILNAALATENLSARVQTVIDCKKRGLVARLSPQLEAEVQSVEKCLGEFSNAWEWSN